MGPGTLREFVRPSGSQWHPAELVTVHDGFRLSVMTTTDLGNGTDDVLFTVSLAADRSVLNPVFSESFALREDGRIEELTDEEWAFVT